MRLSIEEAINSSWIKLHEISDTEKNLLTLNRIESNNVLDNFKKFEKYSIFKKEILFSIAKISKDDELSQIRKIFIEFDQDNSGTIDRNEVKSIFIRLGIEISEVSI